MIQSCRCRIGRQGFTLLELLVSIAIFAVVVSSVYGAYRATFHTVDGTEEQVAEASSARVIMERMTADLMSLYSGDKSFFEGKRGEAGGNRADSLTFISTAHLVFHKDARSAGAAMLSYSISETESGLFDLYRSDKVMLPGSEMGQDDDAGELLGRKLKMFRLTYVGLEGDEQEEWFTRSETEGEDNEQRLLELPALVRIELRFGEPDEDGESNLYRTAVALAAPAVKEEK